MHTSTKVVIENELTSKLLTPDCKEYLAQLHRHFNATRLDLLHKRVERMENLAKGKALTYPVETNAIRQGKWKIREVPEDLQKRWVEITGLFFAYKMLGPPTKKGTIHALNSGAHVFMADFEDALAPTWTNLLDGQLNLILANRKQIDFVQKETKQEYKLKKTIAKLFVRPRGWHLPEKHFLVDGTPISGSLFDFGVYFFHNVKQRLQNNLHGTYYYLPKLESYFEARLWNDVFNFSEYYLSVPVGTIRCTVLIETLTGAIEMEEIMFELQDHIVAFNAGRWDYIFSAIKNFRKAKNAVLPDRLQVTMTVPFMRAYTQRLVQVCHKRGAHAIGGMSAFIPSRTDEELNKKAVTQVTTDKNREAGDGFDGTWVAHPDLVKIAMGCFERVLKDKPHQKEITKDDLIIHDFDITNFEIPGSTITENGVRTNISVAIQYIYFWLTGVGAVGINSMMEDAATAEISRTQLWQWIYHGCKTAEGKLINESLYKTLRNEEVEKLRSKLTKSDVLKKTVELLDSMVLKDEMIEFLTTPAYDMLTGGFKAKL